MKFHSAELYRSSSEPACNYGIRKYAATGVNVPAGSILSSELTHRIRIYYSQTRYPGSASDFLRMLDRKTPLLPIQRTSDETARRPLTRRAIPLANIIPAPPPAIFSNASTRVP